jgi:hypothetical protein
MKLSLSRNLVIIIFFLSLSFININKPAYALFEIGADAFNIDFGFMNIGDSKELQERGTYQSEITCTSDNARAWYLKIQSFEPLKSAEDYIPYENFTWKVVEVLNGDGVIYNKDRYNPFSAAASLVYQGGPNDSGGREVKVRLKYSLSIPRNQVAGNYRTIIHYTMTEMP